MASVLIRVLRPLPWVAIKSPSPPRIAHPPAKLFQKPMAGVRAAFPARGWVPVGVKTESSAVSEKSFVSWSKKRGVNDISPNPEWLFDVDTVRRFGSTIGKPLAALLRIKNGTFVMRSRRRLNGVKIVYAPR